MSELSKRDENRLKLYADYMRSMGLYQEVTGQPNGWRYSYRPKESYWLVDMVSPTKGFEPKIYQFEWKKRSGKLYPHDLHADGSAELVKFLPKTFREFKKYIKQQVEELNRCELYPKQQEMERRLQKLNGDFYD